jgi:hypothetical protein
MHKVLLFLFLIFSFSSSVFAGTVKHITLKDGSVIKGELVSFENGVYTLQTENLGRLQLPEVNVVSIAEQAAATIPPVNSQGTTAVPNFSTKVNAMQTQIMGDPQAMKAVQAMAEDPEIAAMISDPAFVQQLTSAVSNNNVDSVAGDPKIQQLMNNPKMQTLIQQLQDNNNAQQQ